MDALVSFVPGKDMHAALAQQLEHKVKLARAAFEAHGTEGIPSSHATAADPCSRSPSTIHKSC